MVMFLLFGAAACNQWLDLEPENKLVQQEFWQKKEDVSAVMAAMYDAFRETSTPIWIWGELRGNMVDIGGSGVEGYARIASGEILPSNGTISWSRFYNAINLANTILVFADDVLPLDETFDPKLQQSYEAEALFVRSKCYFDLVRVWKEAPLVLQASSSDTVDFSIAKNSEYEIIKQIEIDLLLAKTKAYTNEYAGNPAQFKGRANIHSINTLLADVYLWGEQYQKCIDACDEVINSGMYQLNNANNWFELYYPGNSAESIFEFQYDSNLENESNPFNRDVIPISGSKKCSTNPYALDIFSEQDFRFGDPDPSCKYQYSSLTPKTKRRPSEDDANMIQYRYAEVLLMKAEALVELERYSEANDLLNEILQRATLQPIAIPNDKEVFRNAILEERAREFAYEGKRWFDVLRYAKRNDFENKHFLIQMILEGADVKLKPVLRSKILDTMSYYLPIPEGDILTNPNLVQNPFYDR